MEIDTDDELLDARNNDPPSDAPAVNHSDESGTLIHMILVRKRI